MNSRLTPTEKRFMDVLISSDGQPVSRPDLYQQVWSVTWNPGTNRIDVIVRRLRTKNYSIRSHRGIGYSYHPDYEQATANDPGEAATTA